MHTDGFIYCKIKKGMYDLKQVTILAYKISVTRFEKKRYIPISLSLSLSKGLFKHITRKTVFALCVNNDFVIQYNSEDDILHLKNTLLESCGISSNTNGHNYCSLTLDCAYDKVHVNVHMPSCVAKTLKKFKHPTTLKSQQTSIVSSCYLFILWPCSETDYVNSA